MKHASITSAWLIAIVAVALLGAVGAQAQTLEKVDIKKFKPEPEKAELPDPSDPGYHTAILRQFSGTWEVQARMWFAADAEPVMMRGTTINEMIMEGAFLQSQFKGEMMGEVVVGKGFDGWDPVKQKIVSVWMDSSDPGITTYEGDYDPETKTITAFGTMSDQEAGKIRETKGVTTIKSGSMHTYQGWVKGDDGEWQKMIEIIFGRVR